MSLLISTPESLNEFENSLEKSVNLGFSLEDKKKNIL